MAPFARFVTQIRAFCRDSVSYSLEVEEARDVYVCMYELRDEISSCSRTR